jgi:predicted transcriptional regulator of viral defense system
MEKKHSVIQTRELVLQGIARKRIPALVNEGKLERISRGLYRWTHAPVTEQYNMVLAVKAVPKGILSLLTALRYYGIGTQNPTVIWMAIPRRSRKPKIDNVPVRFVSFSGNSITYGVKEIKIDGIPARITDQARTVIDVFRYRNKVGLDVALEALKDSLRKKIVTRDQLRKTADVMRVLNVMRPYLEAYSA